MQERIKPMWPSIIKILLADGHSQKALADKVGVNQSTICRLAEGVGPEPRWSVGAELIAMAGGQQLLAEKHGLDVASFLGSTVPPAQQPAHPLRRATDHPHPLRRKEDFAPGALPATAGEG